MLGKKIPDETVLAIASEANRILMTLNRKHFIRLHTEKSDHSGIIVCTFDPDFEGQANRIQTALEAQTATSGQLIRVNRPPG